MSMKFRGRPKAFNSVEELETLIEAYFEYCDNYTTKQVSTDKKGNVIETTISSPKPYTVAGLCAFMGISRETLHTYSENAIYSDTIKTAKSFIEADKIEGCMLGKYNPAISIFDLKNNHKYDNKEIVEHIGNNNTTTVIGLNMNDLKDLTDEQLRVLNDIKHKLGGGVSKT